MLPGRKYTPDSIGRLLLKRLWMIVTPMFVGLLIALIIARAQPDLFRAETVVQVLPQRVPDSYVRSTVTTTVEERLKSIQEVVKSRTLLEELVTSLDLYPDERRAGSMDAVIETMRRNVAIAVSERAPGTFRGPGAVVALRVTFTHGEKEKALVVTKRLTELLVDENARMRGNLAEQTSQFLERQKTEARQRLEEQERKLEAFRQQHAGRLPTQMPTNMQAAQNMQMQLQQMVQSLNQDRDRKMMLERLYNDTLTAARTAPVVTPAAQAANNDPTALPVNASAQQRLTQARSNLAALELRLTPEHPDIRRAKRQISELEKLAEAESQRASASPGGTAPTVSVSPEENARREQLSQRKAEIESLDRQIAFREQEVGRIRGQIADYQSKVDAVPGIESEWIKLSRDYDTLNDAYQSLLTKSEDSKVAASLEQQQIGEQFRILDQPRVSDQTTGSNRTPIVLGGVAIGLLLGLLTAGFLEFRDTSFRTEADVMNALSLPVLAAVPFSRTAGDLAHERRRRVTLGATVAGLAVVYVGVFVYLQLWKYFV